MRRHMARDRFSEAKSSEKLSLVCKVHDRYKSRAKNTKRSLQAAQVEAGDMYVKSPVEIGIETQYNLRNDDLTPQCKDDP